jgi:hypothetical protein
MRAPSRPIPHRKGPASSSTRAGAPAGDEDQDRTLLAAAPSSLPVRSLDPIPKCARLPLPDPFSVRESVRVPATLEFDCPRFSLADNTSKLQPCWSIQYAPAAECFRGTASSSSSTMAAAAAAPALACCFLLAAQQCAGSLEEAARHNRGFQSTVSS